MASQKLKAYKKPILTKYGKLKDLTTEIGRAHV